MNWVVYIWECVIFLAVFTALVVVMMLASPLSFISDYPPEIQERYYRTQHKQAEKAKLTKLMVAKKITAIIVYIFLLAWMAHLAGASTFWQALAAVYGYIVIWAAYDSCFIDWLVFPNIKRFRLPGTEDMDKEYHQKLFHVKVLLPAAPIAAVCGLIVAWLTVSLW